MLTARVGCVLTLAAFTFTGCSPEEAGAAGLFLASDGTLTVQFAVCSGDIDGVEVWYRDGEQDEAEERVVKKVKLDRPISGVKQVSLGKPTGQPGGDLRFDPEESYELLATSRDNRWSISGPSFATLDLESLAEGGLIVADEDGSAERIGATPEDWAHDYCERR